MATVDEVMGFGGRGMRYQHASNIGHQGGMGDSKGGFVSASVVLPEGPMVQRKLTKPTGGRAMKVFIGWSGERSHQMGQALREWMPLVLYFVEPWLSDKDIAAGERWSPAMAKELESCNFGVICVTRENASSPWIQFEAGSLAKSFDESRVIPLLLDMEFSEISGPLAQFQAKKADRDGLRDVMQSINAAATDPVQEDRAGKLFDNLWTELEKQLSSIPGNPAAAKAPRSHGEILEELVAGVRSLESRLREMEETASGEPFRGDRPRRLSRPDPRMLREAGMMIGEGPGDPIQLLLLVSLIREDVPWLYELGVDAYRAVRSGAPDAGMYFRRFRRATEMLVRLPFAEELGIHPKELQMLASQIERSMMELTEFGALDTDRDEQTTRGRRKRAVEVDRDSGAHNAI